MYPSLPEHGRCSLNATFDFCGTTKKICILHKAPSVKGVSQRHPLPSRLPAQCFPHSRLSTVYSPSHNLSTTHWHLDFYLRFSEKKTRTQNDLVTRPGTQSQWHSQSPPSQSLRKTVLGSQPQQPFLQDFQAGPKHSLRTSRTGPLVSRTQNSET